MNTSDLQKKLVDSISRLIDGKISDVTKNATVVKTGIVTACNGNNSYTVKINGREYAARSNFNHSVGNVVWVIIANGNYSNIFILYDQNITIS